MLKRISLKWLAVYRQADIPKWMAGAVSSTPISISATIETAAGPRPGSSGSSICGLQAPNKVAQTKLQNNRRRKVNFVLVHLCIDDAVETVLTFLGGLISLISKKDAWFHNLAKACQHSDGVSLNFKFSTLDRPQYAWLAWHTRYRCLRNRLLDIAL